MKKILLCIGQLYGGGAERVASIWSKKLSEAGYDTSILVYGRKQSEYEISPDVKILSVTQFYEDFAKISYFKRYFTFRKILKETKPDVVISFLPTTQIWVNFASIGLKHKKIETVRNNPWLLNTLNIFGKALWKNCFNRADSIIVQTKEQIEFFSKKNQKKCVVIANPISDECLNEKPREFPEKINNFIASGRLTSQKNYPLMIKAFKMAHDNNPNIKLNIFGTGNSQYYEKLNKLIKDEGMEESIFLKGYTSDMLKEFYSADAFLMTSDYEGLPNALIEAMGSRLVCISTDCKTGPKDLIDNGKNGFLAKVGDANSVADCIVTAINLSSSEIENIGINGRRKILDFCSDENSFKTLIEIIEREV